MYAIRSYYATFGGGPMACACALAVLNTIEKDNLLTAVSDAGQCLISGLKALEDKHPIALKAQGMGLLTGLKIAPSVSVGKIIRITSYNVCYTKLLRAQWPWWWGSKQ